MSRETISLDAAEVQAQMAGDKVVFIHGWRIRAPESVARQADRIREYFRPVAGLDHASRQPVERLRQKADLVVGVLVQRGGYCNWQGGKYFFPVSHYVTWMQELTARFPGRKVSFLICSDEPRKRG